MMDINQKEVLTFLKDMQARAYGSGEGVLKPPYRPYFDEFLLKEDDYTYHDSYKGGTRSWGQEVVIKNEKPIWSQVYGGGLLKECESDNQLESKAFSFLKKVLRFSKTLTDKFYPRGPEVFVEGNWEYKSSWEGDFEMFSGKEYIFYKGKYVHIYYFSGGVII